MAAHHANDMRRIVRLGINHTPALVVNGKLLAQDLSVDSLADHLQTRLPGPGARL